MSDNSINVVLFSTLFPHAGEPTLGIFVENRLLNLIGHHPNIKVTVIAPVPWFPFKSGIFGSYGRSAKAAAIEQRQGITIHHPRYLVVPKIGMLLTPHFLYRAAWRCLQRLMGQGLKVDLIDAHYLFPDGVAAARLASVAKVPFVVTARGSDVTQIGLMPKPRKRIAAAMAQASHVITVSENLRRDLILMGVSGQKISTLRNGVDLMRFKENGRQKSRERIAKGDIMIFAGWLIPRKRLDLVLEVTKRVSNLTTIIVGDGPQRQLLQEQVLKLGIENRVMFLGQKEPTDMPALYSAADVLLLPSDREGWANVLLESMACGTPVVSRSIGGAPDLVTEAVAGRIVDSANPDLLADAVRDILSKKPDRSAVRDFAARFDWKETSNGQKRIFDTAIASWKV